MRYILRGNRLLYFVENKRRFFEVSVSCQTGLHDTGICHHYFKGMIEDIEIPSSGLDMSFVKGAHHGYRY